MNELKYDANDLGAYQFDLPRELIAQTPTRERSSSRMLIVDRSRGTIDHAHVRDLPDYLNAGDVVVVNDSKVMPARLIGFRTNTKGRWEGLFLREDSSGLAEFLTKTRGRIEPGEMITLKDREGREQDRLVLAAYSDKGRMLLRCESGRSWTEVMEATGRVPLPPYIREGQMVDEDIQRYQTVYARAAGSVAAPTAGLHFTPDLISRLREAGIALVSVTLHVGLGTFSPIKSDRIEDHKMHSEVCEVSSAVAKRLELARETGGRIMAVGTTSVRTLESAAMNNSNAIGAWQGETEIFIRPGHAFKSVDCMMTNFHLPKSTLLVLVSAFAGRDLILKAYEEAIREQYRFYSYGDCMLIL